MSSNLAATTTTNNTKSNLSVQQEAKYRAEISDLKDQVSIEYICEFLSLFSDLNLGKDVEQCRTGTRLLLRKTS